MLVQDTSATRGLADFAVGLRYDDLPKAVVDRLKTSILDALGCCLLGVTLPWTRMLIDLVEQEGGNPRARVIGTALKTSVSQAVLIGATAGHGFELDDIHAAAHLHAGSLALPTALAVADVQDGIDGRRLIAAIAAGYEVGYRVALAATGKLFMRGFHFQGSCGPFVAAATDGESAGAQARGCPPRARHRRILRRRPDGGRATCSTSSKRWPRRYCRVRALRRSWTPWLRSKICKRAR